MGLDMTAAYNMFLVQAVRTQSIPFDIALDRSDRETVEVLKDAMADRDLSRRCSDMNGL